MAEDGQLVQIEGDLNSLDPSPIARSLLDAADPDVCVQRPAVRRGYLERGPVYREPPRRRAVRRRLSWNVAVTSWAGELTHARADRGDEAVYGGSYGWGLRWPLPPRQGQIHRFLKVTGGYTASSATTASGRSR